MLTQTLDTRGGSGWCDSPRWRWNFNWLGDALAFVATNSRADLCSRDRELRIDWPCRDKLTRPLNVTTKSDFLFGVLSHTQDVLHLTGVFWYRSFKELSQEDGKTKNWTMKRLLRGTLRVRNSSTGEQIKNGRPKDKITHTRSRPIRPLPPTDQSGCHRARHT